MTKEVLGGGKNKRKNREGETWIGKGREGNLSWKEEVR